MLFYGFIVALLRGKPPNLCKVMDKYHKAQTFLRRKGRLSFMGQKSDARSAVKAAVRNVKLVNTVSFPAQSVNQAFAIVKAVRREDLGIIKKAEIYPVKNSSKIKEFFTIKHLGETIKEQIFGV